MNDEVLGDDPERTIELVPTSPDWLRDPKVVKGLVDAAIRNIDERRADGGSGSKSAPLPAQPAVLTLSAVQPVGPHADPESDAAIRDLIERKKREEDEARRRREKEDAYANKEAAFRTARAARLRPPAPKCTPKDWRDPQMHGDAAEVTIRTRNKIMRTAKPRTFVLPEQGMLVCSGGDDAVLTLGTENAKLLPTLGKDFGYDPERRRWIPRKRGPKFKT